jgi:hypothetical protein
MRTLPIVFTGLFVAMPAFGQAQGGPSPAPADKAAPGASEPSDAKPGEAPAAAAPPATATAGVQATATATPAPAAGVVAMQGATPAADATTSKVENSNVSQRGSAAAAADNSWKLEYHGYLRAPMRVGMGRRDNPTAGQSSNTLHYPVLPDDQYLNWQFTSHNKKDWAEMFFSYGNSWAKGTLALQGFNFTDAAWADQVAQFGISQGWVTLTPDLGYENFRLEAKAGSFWSRYGLAGKWDAGEYDTYLFGRTHVMGETVKVDYDIDDATTLWFEQGLGAKRPDPSQFNNARFTMLNHLHAGLKLGSDIEFSGHYLAAWTQEEDRIMRGANAINPSAPTPNTLSDPYNPPNYPSTLVGLPDGKMWIAGVDARMELGRFGFVYAGYSHIGATDAISVAPAVEVLHAFGGGQYQLGLTDNYFGPSCQASNTPGDYAQGATTNPTNGMSTTDGRPLPGNGTITNTLPTGGYQKTPGNHCSMGTGSVDSVLAQWEFSLTNFTQISGGGQKFWGDGTDLKFTLYGMLNKVKSDMKDVLVKNGKSIFDGNTKLKYGIDVQYQALPWLTFATRFDRVQPNSNIPEQSFMILSPRVVFKSKWNTREQISFQYSRYMYNQRECDAGASPAYYASGTQGIPYTGHPYVEAQQFCTQPPAAPTSSEGFGSTYETQDNGLRGAPTTRPDVNVFKVEASMWW